MRTAQFLLNIVFLRREANVHFSFYTKNHDNRCPEGKNCAKRNFKMEHERPNEYWTKERVATHAHIFEQQKDNKIGIPNNDQKMIQSIVAEYPDWFSHKHAKRVKTYFIGDSTAQTFLEVQCEEFPYSWTLYVQMSLDEKDNRVVGMRYGRRLYLCYSVKFQTKGELRNAIEFAYAKIKNCTS